MNLGWLSTCNFGGRSGGKYLKPKNHRQPKSRKIMGLPHSLVVFTCGPFSNSCVVDVAMPVFQVHLQTKSESCLEPASSWMITVNIYNIRSAMLLPSLVHSHPCAPTFSARFLFTEWCHFPCTYTLHNMVWHHSIHSLNSAVMGEYWRRHSWSENGVLSLTLTSSDFSWRATKAQHCILRFEELNPCIKFLLLLINTPSFMHCISSISTEQFYYRFTTSDPSGGRRDDFEIDDYTTITAIGKDAKNNTVLHTVWAFSCTCQHFSATFYQCHHHWGL